MDDETDLLVDGQARKTCVAAPGVRRPPGLHPSAAPASAPLRVRGQQERQQGQEHTEGKTSYDVGLAGRGAVEKFVNSSEVKITLS